MAVSLQIQHRRVQCNNCDRTITPSRPRTAPSSLRAEQSNPDLRKSYPGLLRRGACHRAGHFGPDPLAPRNDETKIRSRGAIFCRRCRLANFFAPRMSLSRRSGDFGFFLSLLEKQKGSGTPVDADPYPPHPAVRLCVPLRKQLACRGSTRGSRQRDFRPQGSASGHASWDAAGAYDPLIALPGEERTTLHGRYPRRACPSPVKHLTRRSIVPAA
jgi:hypothetical protein